MPRSRPERRLRRAQALLAAWGVAVSGGCTTLHVDEERTLGADLHAQLSWELPLLRDRVVEGYVSSVGERVAAAAGPQPFVYSFHVVVHPDLNAFAGPGGHVYVHTGTLLAVRDVSELAGVLAHEVGHVVERDVAENYERRVAAGRAQRVGSLAAGLVAGAPGAAGVNLIGGLTSLAVLNSFTRDDERQADALAVEILPAAGYSPEGLASFFRTLLQQAEGGAPEFLRSHPRTASRAEDADRRAAAAEGPSSDGLRRGLERSDGGRLEIIQRRIRLLTGEVEPVL